FVAIEPDDQAEAAQHGEHEDRLTPGLLEADVRANRLAGAGRGHAQSIGQLVEDPLDHVRLTSFASRHLEPVPESRSEFRRVGATHQSPRPTRRRWWVAPTLQPEDPASGTRLWPRMGWQALWTSVHDGVVRSRIHWSRRDTHEPASRDRNPVGPL